MINEGASHAGKYAENVAAKPVEKTAGELVKQIENESGQEKFGQLHPLTSVTELFKREAEERYTGWKLDVVVLNKLIHEQNPREFASAFIDRLLDVNKVRGLQKTAKKATILGKLGVQLAKGETDNMMLLRTLMTEFTDSSMNVPIQIRIMIRNIEAFKKLNKKYGLALGRTTV
jgi:hypothetical protein